MYKISEVAEMLSVEKVKIFETLIVHDEILSPYVVKERHLSYVTEDGVKELERIIFGREPIIEDVEVIDENIDDVEFEMDRLDEFIQKSHEKKDLLKNEIIDLKRQVNMLDKELRMKDEAIIHYQGIFEEDMQWIMTIEKKIELEREKLKTDEKKSGFFNRLKK